MMFALRSPVIRAMAILAAILVACDAQQQQQQLRREDKLQALNNQDLTDLLDRDLDERFLFKAPRQLQEGDTASPSSAPTPSATPSADGDRGGLQFSASPTSMSSSLTSSPSSSPTPSESEAPVTSGASSWRSPAGVISALVLVGSVSAAAMA